MHSCLHVQQGPGASSLAQQACCDQGLDLQCCAPAQVLRDVNLAVQPGQLHILLGPNGCGKSTLLRVLGGLLRASAGAAAVQGRTAFVFQNPDHQILMPSVGADVAFGLGRSAAQRPARLRLRRRVQPTDQWRAAATCCPEQLPAPQAWQLQLPRRRGVHVQACDMWSSQHMACSKLPQPPPV